MDFYGCKWLTPRTLGLLFVDFYGDKYTNVTMLGTSIDIY